MRTDHCMARRCAGASEAAKRSGWASRCKSFQRWSSASRSSAKAGAIPKISKSLDSRFMTSKSRQDGTHWRLLVGYSATVSDSETLAATATVALIGVVEAEAFVQALAHEIELCAVDVGQTLRVHQHLDAVVLEHHIFRCNLVGVFQLVSEAGAAGGLDAQAHAHALATLGDVTGDVPRSGFGDRNSHGAGNFAWISSGVSCGSRPPRP